MTKDQKKAIGILVGIAVVIILAFVIFKGIPMYQYRLQGDDVQKYEECLNKYHEDIDNYISEYNDLPDVLDIYSEYAFYFEPMYEKMYEEFYEKVDTMYSSTRNWPEKYKELYFYTFIAFKNFERQQHLDYLSSDYLSVQEAFVKSKKWQKIWEKLEKKLKNKYYVPEDLEKYKKEMQELLGDEKLPEYVRVQ